MSSPSHVAETPITDRNELVATLASGEKPQAQWRIGTEHEKFGFRLDDLRPPTFDGDRGIEALLNGLTRFGWDPVQEDGRTIALLRDNASVTLEPAGQLELSGAAVETIHQTCVETGTHLNEVAWTPPCSQLQQVAELRAPGESAHIAQHHLVESRRSQDGSCRCETSRLQTP